MKFTKEIFSVLNPHCHIGEEIINHCIKTIEYSFEIMDIDSSEKYEEKLNIVVSEDVYLKVDE